MDLGGRSLEEEYDISASDEARDSNLLDPDRGNQCAPNKIVSRGFPSTCRAVDPSRLNKAWCYCYSRLQKSWALGFDLSVTKKQRGRGWATSLFV
jgi:hypothetical protein